MTAMAVSQRARHAYQVSQVAEQDPMTLIVMLYDGMLGFLTRGIDAIEQGDRVSVGEQVRRASDIVGELQAVLNLEEGGEIAANLDRLYSYCRRRIVNSHLHMDPAGLREVVNLMSPLRDAWDEARNKQRGASA